MDKQLQESQNQISKLSNEFRSLEKKLDNEKRKEKEINKKISCLTNQDINNKNELKIVLET
ncbi:hypothetical protein [Spiroplasma endosymbiont of Dactylopius coccus]